MRKYQGFLENFTDFIFLEDEPRQADVIFVPGNGYPQMAERAASLWREGYAPFVLPSGKYSVTKGHFSGVMAEKEKYPGPYATEWEFLADVLRKNGVPGTPSSGRIRQPIHGRTPYIPVRRWSGRESV